MTRTTVNFSVRVNEKLYNRGEYLRAKHPRTVSHSRIYAAGLKSILADAESRGEYVPEDPYAEIIAFEEAARADLDIEIAELKTRQKKHLVQASRTLAGAAGKSEEMIEVWDKGMEEYTRIPISQYRANPEDWIPRQAKA
jgi:hypothetical protein